MQTIWKFSFSPSNNLQQAEMPKGSQIVSVQAQNNLICLWAKVDPKKEKIERLFLVRGTGEAWGLGEEWVGTVQMSPFVWHLLEILPPKN